MDPNEALAWLEDWLPPDPDADARRAALAAEIAAERDAWWAQPVMS